MSSARLFVLVGLFACAAPAAGAQTLTQRGFADARMTLFPQDTATDRVHAVGDVLLREEVFVRPSTWLRVAAGLDVRANTHDQVDASWRVDAGDRGTLRPALSIRRLAATVTHGPLTLDAGKQFIRWGKTDIVTPTDRFAPRDFINVIDNEFLAVSGVRAVVAHRGQTLDAVWVPRFTPSRIPLLDQRWAPPPPGALAAFTIRDAGADIPRRSQAGLRWGYVGNRFESSVSFFDGLNHLPDFDVSPSTEPGRIDLIRRYPAMRAYGADIVVPLPVFIVKAEASYFTTGAAATDEYVLYVVQLERQTGEWVLVGGYAGEVVTAKRSSSTFAPDRGLTRSIVARASYTIDTNRSAAIEGALRQNGDGAYMKGEYSQARGQHWRATLVAVLIGGRLDDFLGQYRRNSHAAITVRYSF